MDRSYINPPHLLETIDNGLQGRAPHGTRVLVLGAGMAGLVAATELKRAGYDVEVVEAQTRVGGRIHTLREPFSHGLYAEAGAMRVPSCHELVLRYVRRFGLPLKPFRSHNDNGWCFVHYERRRLRHALINPAIGIDQELAERDGIDLQEMWRLVLDPLIVLLSEDPDHGWSTLAERLQNVSLYDFLRNEGWSDAVIETYGLLAGFETLLFASAFEFVREFLLGLRDDTVAIPGGMDQLSHAFLPELPELRGCIRYGTPVTALDQDESGVKVFVRRGASAETLEADFAVVTIPLPVLRHIEVLTPFSRTKQRAIRSVHYEAATKIFFEMRERFWETREGIWGGASVTDLAIRNIYYPEHGRDTGRGVLLASYSHGQDAHRWGALTPEARLAEALENLSEIHPEAVSMVEGGTSVCWSHDPYAGGAYAFFQPHQEALLHDSIATPEGRFYLAGEHASLQHRWLQGAVESALRVAGDIHARVMTRDTVATELSSAEDPRPGGLLNDAESLAAASGDFGGIWKLKPRYLLRPRDTTEIARTVAYARKHGLPIAARGVGHSAGAQSQVEDGIAIDMTAMRDIRRIDAVNRVIEVDAGVRWQEVMDALLPLGLTPRVVTDWLHLTMGGTVSAGGVGAQSFRHGIQADLVESMTVVTGTGEVVDCSREHESELFDAVRGGLGQFGIITRVEMRLVDAPAAVLLDHRVYDDLERLCADMEVLTANDSAVEGLLAHAVVNDVEAIARSQSRDPAVMDLRQSPASGRWVYDLEVTRYPQTDGSFCSLPLNLGHIGALSTQKRLTFREFVSRIPPIVERDSREGQAPHPEAAMFVPQHAAAGYFQQTMQELAPEDMGGGPVLLIPLDQRCIESPIFRIPDEDRSWLFAMLRAARSEEDIERLGIANMEFYERGVALGANRYPCDALQRPADNTEWAVHFGRHWPRVLQLKKRYDPDGLLAPQLGIRP